MIFNLFKSKPTLRELIPDGFIDIHSHVLPGIDDGAKDIKESIELLKGMEKLGFSKVIGTPHTYPGMYNNNDESIVCSYDKIIKSKKADISVSYASEYMAGKYLIEKVEEKKILTLKENYVLVESNFSGEPQGFEEIIFKIKINGFNPVVAHPERYIYYFNNKRKYFKLKNMGCKFQLNLLSTTGYYGDHIAKISDYLLKNNLIDFVGSDIHNKNHINQFENKLKIKEIDKLEIAISNNRIFI